MEKNAKSPLRKALPHGGIKEVARRSNTSIHTVSRVLKGGSQNPTVKKALADYLTELAATEQQLSRAVETTNQI